MSSSGSIEMLEARAGDYDQSGGLTRVSAEVFGDLATNNVGIHDGMQPSDPTDSPDMVRTDAQDMQSAREVRYRTEDGRLINFEISADAFGELLPEKQLLVMASRFKGVDFKGKTPMETMQSKLITERPVDMDVVSGVLELSSKSVKITERGEKMLQEIAEMLVVKEYGEYGEISLLDAVRKYVQESGGIVFDEVDGPSAIKKAEEFLQTYERYRGMLVRASLSAAVKSGSIQAHKIGNRINAISQEGYELTERDLEIFEELRDAETEAKESTSERQQQPTVEEKVTYADRLKKVLRERGAGIYPIPGQSVSAQLQELLGIEKSKELNQFVSNCRNDAEILRLSFPVDKKSSNSNKRQTKRVEYIGLVEFQDDPVTKLQLVASELRAQCEAYLRNITQQHKAPSPAYESYAGLLELAVTQEWTDYPLSELEEVQIKMQKALKKLETHNKTLTSAT